MLHHTFGDNIDRVPSLLIWTGIYRKHFPALHLNRPVRKLWLVPFLDWQFLSCNISSAPVVCMGMSVSRLGTVIAARNRMKISAVVSPTFDRTSRPSSLETDFATFRSIRLSLLLPQTKRRTIIPFSRRSIPNPTRSSMKLFRVQIIGSSINFSSRKAGLLTWKTAPSPVSSRLFLYQSATTLYLKSFSVSMDCFPASSLSFPIPVFKFGGCWVGVLRKPLLFVSIMRALILSLSLGISATGKGRFPIHP